MFFATIHCSVSSASTVTQVRNTNNLLFASGSLLKCFYWALAFQNGTYLSNNGYPSTVSGASDTTYTISPPNPQDTCAIRLDFEDFVLPLQNAGVVSASTARLQVTGPTGKNPPIIGGTNTGMHSESQFLMLPFFQH